MVVAPSNLGGTLCHQYCLEREMRLFNHATSGGFGAVMSWIIVPIEQAREAHRYEMNIEQQSNVM